MNERAKRLEKLKNAVIVVLFLTTILLLNLSWRSEGQGSFRLSNVLDFISEDVWVPETEEFLRPDHLVYGFGDATFSVDRSRQDLVWEDLLSIFSRQSSTSSFLVSEVTDQQYREMLTGYRSLKVVFPCEFPFADLCERSGVNRTAALEQVPVCGAFILTAAAPESFFVEGGGQCWRLLSDSEEDVASVLLSTLERTEPTYYTAGSMLGNDNMALLPLAGSDNLAAASWTAEDADEAERASRQMAESVFGENFDFVRRITDSFGNVTYMYGYGERTLTCLASGSYEYKTEQIEGPDPGFFGSLQTAIAFTATHGGWGSDRRDLSFVLCGASEDGAGRSKVYSFEFAQKLAGIKVLSEEGPAITVKVCGGEVCYYRRAVLQASAAFGDAASTADAANVLAGNCHLINSVLGANLLAATSDEEFSFVAEKFRDAAACYVCAEETLEPAWMITMEGGSKFFFGLYDAVPLGFTRQ